MKYFVKTTSIENGKGYWNYLKVEIFQKDGEAEKKIGEYQRNYGSLYDTFYPFELDGKEYALYSKDYTSTRIMTLPDCEDLCGEERDAWGFCPTGYYVPTICVPYPLPTDADLEPKTARHSSEWVARVPSENGGTRFLYPSNPEHPKHSKEFIAAYEKECERTSAIHQEWQERHPYTDITAPFGFVSGCVWGDDSSWKIQFLDLSKISEGVLTRDDRFGYIELPAKAKLKDVIYTGHYDYDHPIIEIGVATEFRIDGTKIDD